MSEYDRWVEKAEFFAHQVKHLNDLLQHQVEGINIIKSQLHHYISEELRMRAYIEAQDREATRRD